MAWGKTKSAISAEFRFTRRNPPPTESCHVTYTPTLNPSQAVERIREIIVGRHLEHLEGRVTRLESSPRPVRDNLEMPIFEDRLLITEAKVEALNDHVHRLDSSREESLQLRHDAQRLAAQIQELSHVKADVDTVPAVENLERKLGVWLTDWQKSLHVRLESRDRALAAKVDSDLRGLRDSIESRLSKLESGNSGDVSDRLEKIAEAARALAESVAAFSNVSPSKA
ncbi:MAG: hypothetical protein IZT59_06295 [Verrucomicrobia bacterium]|jgi:chaperonin cofactor prefoldin|nr:hypothetical protein [Verrucomicrobiota bacterium]|tara:strand:- start:1031 stop:1708 length:678 start_codon:yes stop_codon:yes gene_type:complete